MSAFATDVARKAAPPFPDMGIDRGWESTALLVTTLLLVSLGLVTLYSASALLAQRQDLALAGFIQADVDMPLQALVHVPVGFAVADQQDVGHAVQSGQLRGTALGLRV